MSRHRSRSRPTSSTDEERPADVFIIEESSKRRKSRDEKPGPSGQHAVGFGGRRDDLHDKSKLAHDMEKKKKKHAKRASKPLPLPGPTGSEPTSQNQDSDDALDDYYGGRTYSYHAALPLPPVEGPYDDFGIELGPDMRPSGRPGRYSSYFEDHPIPTAYAMPPPLPQQPPGPGPPPAGVHERIHDPPRPERISSYPGRQSYSGPPPPPLPGRMRPDPLDSIFADDLLPGPNRYHPPRRPRPYMPPAPWLPVARSHQEEKKSKHLWSRAATYNTPSSSTLTVAIRLVVVRRGARLKSRSFVYTQQSWTDADFAARLQASYRSLKTREVSLLQKLIAFKTIAFVYLLQYRASATGPKSHRWMITNRVPITPIDDPDSRSMFMYQLRHPNAKNRNWAHKLDALILPGAVIDVEVKETFDSIKIYWGLLLAVLLSLGVALAYGFAMDNDFSTGFSIASWIITAFGFLAAVIAAGEYFGLEKPTATFQPDLDLEAGRLPPLGMGAAAGAERNPFRPVDLPEDLHNRRYR